MRNVTLTIVSAIVASGMILSTMSCSAAEGEPNPNMVFTEKNMPAQPDDQKNEALDARGLMMAENIQKALALLSTEKDLYLLYDASEAEYLLFTADEFEVAEAIADAMVGSDATGVRKAPTGKGWKYVGKGSSKADVLKYARNLSKQIGENQDFEIHVERGDDGSWYLWYRIV